MEAADLPLEEPPDGPPAGLDDDEGEGPPAGTSRSRQLARELLVWRDLEAEWAANYVYGVIATLVAVGGEDLASHPNPLSAAGEIVVGVAAIWLAHAFSLLVGDWIADRPLAPSHVRARLRHSWPILSAAIPPTLVVGLAGADAYSIGTGLFLGELVGIVALFLIGFWAAVASKRRRGVRLVFPAALVIVGWLIVGLEQAAKRL